MSKKFTEVSLSVYPKGTERPIWSNEKISAFPLVEVAFIEDGTSNGQYAVAFKLEKVGVKVAFDTTPGILRQLVKFLDGLEKKQPLQPGGPKLKDTIQ